MGKLKQWCLGIAVLLVIAFVASCGSNGNGAGAGKSKTADKDSVKKGLIDSMIVSAENAKDYDRKFFLADSLEKTGDISMVRKAEAEVYYKKALSVEKLDDDDVLYYSRAARTLSQTLSVKNDYETTLRVAMPAVEKLEGRENAQSRDMAVLYYVIGSAQMYLGHDKDAAESYENAFVHYKNSILGSF